MGEDTPTVDLRATDWENDLLPIVQRQARSAFRNRAPHHREEHLADAVAESWRLWRSLLLRGKDPHQIGLWHLANWAVRLTHGGRKFGNGNNPQHEALNLKDTASLERIVQDHDWTPTSNDQTPADAVASKMDFVAFIGRLSHRERLLVYGLILGQHPSELAHRLHISQSRISQLRREIAEKYLRMVNGI